MSIANEPTWAEIASLCSGGSGIPAEVDVPSEAPSHPSGSGDDVPAMGETRNSGSHRTPSMGDPDVDVDWVLASKPHSPSTLQHPLVLMEHLSYKVSRLTLHSEASKDFSLRKASKMLQDLVSVPLVARPHCAPQGPNH